MFDLVHRALMGILALAALSTVRAAAQCNPVIDGTYCASQSVRSNPAARPGSVGMQPVNSIARDLSVGRDQPATFGAITFQGGGSRCVGLLRRGACN
jgi:hypothetical protein